MILLFFLMFLVVLSFELAIMLGEKDPKTISISLGMKLGVFDKLIQFHQIVDMDVKALKKNEQGDYYGNKFCHLLSSLKIRFSEEVRKELRFSLSIEERSFNGFKGLGNLRVLIYVFYFA